MAVNYNAITNEYELTTTIALPGVANYTVLAVNGVGTIIGLPLLDGQLLIGQSTSVPNSNYLTGSTDGVTVTNSSGNITLGTVQPIAPTSSPTFSGINIVGNTKTSSLSVTSLTGPSLITCDAKGVIGTGSSGITSAVVGTDASANLHGVALSAVGGNGINNTLAYNGATQILTSTVQGQQNLASGGNVTWGSCTVSNLVSSGINNGTFGLQTGSATVGALTSTSLQASNLIGPAFVTCDAKGNLVTDGSEVASSLIGSGTSSQLYGVNITNANGCNTSYSAGATVGTLACTMTQNLSSSGTPTFAGETLTGALTMGTNSIASCGAIACLSGTSSTLIGSGVGGSLGDANTLIGHSAGATLTTGTRNVMIGDSADTTGGAVTNAISIGYQATNGTSNTAMIGNSSITDLSLGARSTLGSVNGFSKIYISNASSHVEVQSNQTSAAVSCSIPNCLSTDAFIIGSNCPRRWAAFHDESTIIHGNALTTVLSTAQSYGTYWQQLPAAVNDEFSLSFSIGNPLLSTVTLYILTVLAGDEGIQSWTLDGNAVLTLDAYSAALVHDSLHTASLGAVTTGYHVLKCKIASKNASSSDYRCSITKVWVKQAND